MKLINGKTPEDLTDIPNNSVDSLVTDPPYGLKFMNKHWDHSVPSAESWQEVLRVLKPGAYGLVACGTRTQHRMAVNLEDAGFEIRDVISWIHSSGFPKSHNISKAIDQKLKTEGTVEVTQNTPATPEAKLWEGWGTALKPACEFWTLVRKPLEGTVVDNITKWGTGGLNIDGCRVGIDPKVDDPRLGGKGTWGSSKMAKNVYNGGYRGDVVGSSTKGRWPANLIHDGSEEVTQHFPNTKSGFMAKGTPRQMSSSPNKQVYGHFDPDTVENDTYGDQGSAARFFYCAKAGKSERNAGLDKFEETPDKNTHPTVKPIALMRYLCKLITPPQGTIIDPYMGSGTTGCAAAMENFDFIGIEKDPDHFKTCQARIAHWQKQYKIENAQLKLDL